MSWKPSRLLLLLPLVLIAALARSVLAPTSVQAKDPEAAPAELPRPTTIRQLVGDAGMKSANGVDFELVTFDPRDSSGRVVEPAYRVLIEGGLHGNEELTSQFVLWLARRVARGESPLNELAAQSLVGLDFLPRANPDGDLEKTRLNGHGVNLNRNFGVLWGVTRENPGTQSFSEPETRAIRALFRTRHYAAAIDVHGYVNWIVSPSEPEAVLASGGKPLPSQVAAYRRWRAGLKEELPSLGAYQLKSGATLGDGGAFEDWAWWSQGTFAYCLEMETFQRYVHSYRHDFSDLKHKETDLTIDLYKRYEGFIYRTLARAVELRKTGVWTPSPEVYATK